jgi:acyl phosphate:glycerol-3-phosphate acyltransferase
VDEPLKLIAALAYGYVVGAIPSAYLAGRLVKGIDMRNVGSRNVGASNVWYNVGKFWIFPIGLFDLFVKGGTSVWFARDALGIGLETQVAAALLAIAGHNWPIFLRFRGGRGVAPIIGVLIALARMELIMFIIVSVSGWRLTGSSAVWVLVSLALLPLWSVAWDRPVAVVLLMAGIFIITIVKRMTADGPRADSTISWPVVLATRLLMDRDIPDREAWIRRQPPAASGR